jgi:hypothetical protein
MADMDARLILAGRAPDIWGSYDRGLQTAQNEIGAQRQNALAALYQQQGPQIMAGEPNALAALAGQDPGLAMGIRQAQQDYGFNAERMQFDRHRAQQYAQQAAREAEAWVMDKSAAEVAQAQAEAEAAMARVVAPHAMAIVKAVQGDPQAQQQVARAAANMGMSPDEFMTQAFAIDAVAGVMKGITGAMPEQTGPKVGSLPEGSYMIDPNDPTKGLGQIPGYNEPNYRDATPEEAARYGASAGQFGDDGRFYPINPPSGMSLQTSPDGTVTLTQGPGVKPLTEAQGKDNVYATRAKGALADLEPVATALTDYQQQLMGADPTGAVRQYQSPEYQIAVNAGNEFLQAILRKDTGAAITAGEQALYGDTYLPRPGDTPAVLEQKTRARARAVAALESGMDQRQIAMTEKALVDAAKRTGAAPPDQTDPPAAPAVLKFDQNGNRIE